MISSSTSGFPHHNCLNAWLRGNKAVAVPGRGAAAVGEGRDAAVVDSGEGETATAREEGGKGGVMSVRGQGENRKGRFGAKAENTKRRHQKFEADEENARIADGMAR